MADCVTGPVTGLLTGLVTDYRQAARSLTFRLAGGLKWPDSRVANKTQNQMLAVVAVLQTAGNFGYH